LPLLVASSADSQHSEGMSHRARSPPLELLLKVQAGVVGVLRYDGSGPRYYPAYLRQKEEKSQTNQALGALSSATRPSGGAQPGAGQMRFDVDVARLPLNKRPWPSMRRANHAFDGCGSTYMLYQWNLCAACSYFSALSVDPSSPPCCAYSRTLNPSLRIGKFCSAA